MLRLSRPLATLTSLSERRLYQRSLRTGFAFTRTNTLVWRQPFSAAAASQDPPSAEAKEPSNEQPTEKRSRLASLKMKKIQEQRQQFKDDAEVDFYSIPGILVMLAAAGVAYGLYKVDQTKHEGISWFNGSFMQLFSRRNSFEDILKFRKENPFKSMSKDTTALKIFTEHMLNYATMKGNEEGLYSKFYRFVSMPDPPLLPPLKNNSMTQRTLVIDVDTVIHSSWQRETYFKRTQRPLYKEFIWKMASAGWEIVLWSNEESFDWEEHMSVLDDQQAVSHMLWNKDIYYYNGHKCKNLRWLNRKMKNVILLDSNPRSAQLQPENAVILSPWTGDNKNDTELSDVSDFLSYIQMADVADVRPVLEGYEGKHIPSAFRERYIQSLSES